MIILGFGCMKHVQKKKQTSPTSRAEQLHGQTLTHLPTAHFMKQANPGSGLKKFYIIINCEMY